MFLHDQPKLCKQMQTQNILIDEHGASKNTSIATSIKSYYSDDKTTLSSMDACTEKAITASIVTEQKEFCNDSKVSLSPVAIQYLQDSVQIQDIMNRPWLNGTFSVFDDDREMFHEQINMNLLRNSKPLVIRRKMGVSTY